MSDLISRQALYEILDEYDEGKIYWGEAEDRIGNLPSAQPEIIRCKDCSHYSVCADDYMCGLNVLAYVRKDDFCSRGERKDNG